MAAYAPDFTARYKTTYFSNTHQHNMVLRFDAGETSTTTMASLVSDFLAAIEPFLPTDFAVLGAAVASAGSGSYLPTTDVPIAPSVVGNPAADDNLAPQFLSFTGLSNTGQPGRIFLIGVSINPLDAQVANYRIAESENADISNALDVLRGQTDLVANDNTPLIAWHAYANYAFSRYWQRAART